MKKYLIGLIALLALTLTVAAADGKKADASGGTDVGNTICYAVISANGYNSGTPVVEYVNATSDKAGSVIQFYKNTTGLTSASHVNTTVSLPVVSTNGFAENDVVVIRHLATDTYEKRILAAFTSATNLTTTAAPTTAMAVGDMVYKVTATGGAAIPVGNATKELNGGAIASGSPNMPLLLEIDGTSSCQLNAVGARYY